MSILNHQSKSNLSIINLSESSPNYLYSNRSNQQDSFSREGRKKFSHKHEILARKNNKIDMINIFNLKAQTAKIGSNILSSLHNDNIIMKPDIILSSNKQLNYIPVLNFTGFDNLNSLKNTNTGNVINADQNYDSNFNSIRKDNNYTNTLNSMRSINSKNEKYLNNQNNGNDLDLSKVLALYDNMNSDRSSSCKNIRSLNSIDEDNFSLNIKRSRDSDSNLLNIINEQNMKNKSKFYSPSRHSSQLSVSQLRNNVNILPKIMSGVSILEYVNFDEQNSLKTNLKKAINSPSKFKNSINSINTSRSYLLNTNSLSGAKNSESVITENSFEFKLNK